MYTLKGIFPEPKKDSKKNFIKENMKQLKYIQGKTTKDAKLTIKSVGQPKLTKQSVANLGPVKSSPSSKSGKVTLNVAKTYQSNSRKKIQDVRIKKGDMAEFLRRKEMRQKVVEDLDEEADNESEESYSRLKDVGCQTVESNLSQKMAESTKLTVLYPKKEEEFDGKARASGDSVRHKSNYSPQRSPRKAGDALADFEKSRSHLNAILERKDNKDPYLPPGYQKGVLPKYLRERKEQAIKETEVEEQDVLCPSGHVALPDAERKETLRMLRNSFAELVNELNKLPVKTDTLRTRNRKMELEKQLSKLEEGIRVFSRPKVFVKIGE